MRDRLWMAIRLMTSVGLLKHLLGPTLNVTALWC